MRLLRVGTASLMRQPVARAFTTWLEAVSVQASRLLAYRRVSGHLLHRSVSAAWGSWSAHAAERSEALRKLRRGVGYIVLRQLALGFGGWRAGWASGLARQDCAAVATRVGRTDSTKENRARGGGSSGRR